MIISSTSEHNGVVVSQLGRVTPARSSIIPKVISGWVPDNTTGKMCPHMKGKIHLFQIYNTHEVQILDAKYDIILEYHYTI